MLRRMFSLAGKGKLVRVNMNMDGAKCRAARSEAAKD